MEWKPIHCDARRAVLGLALLALPALAADGAAQRAEVQLHLCAEAAAVVRALDLLPEGPAPIETWYFENDRLDLLGGGVTFRLRIGDRRGELTLKAPVDDCARLGFALPGSEGKCEHDVFDGRVRAALSINRVLDLDETRALAAGRVPLADVLSATQVRYLQSRPSLWPLAAGIRPLGPVRVQAYRPRKGRYVVESWSPPGGNPYIEISQKTALADVARTRDALLGRLQGAGVALCTDQSPPTAERLRGLIGRP